MTDHAFDKATGGYCKRCGVLKGSHAAGHWKCTNCPNVETFEREVYCWKCGQGEMVYVDGCLAPENLIALQPYLAKRRMGAESAAHGLDYPPVEKFPPKPPGERMKISGSWFKEESQQLFNVSAWAVVRVKTGEICSIWDEPMEASLVASTGHPGEYRSVLMIGKYHA